MSKKKQQNQGQQRQEKQEQFAPAQKKGGAGKIIALLVVVAIAAVGGWLTLGGGTSDGFAAVKSVSGEVRLDLSAFNDGKAHYYKFSGNKGEIKFFVVKSIDGVVRAAFDACDVCFPEKKGYRQEGNFMVCNNCGQRFRTDLVNEVKGGCNPAPLLRKIDGQQLVISEQDINNGSSYFGG